MAACLPLFRAVACTLRCTDAPACSIASQPACLVPSRPAHHRCTLLHSVLPVVCDLTHCRDSWRTVETLLAQKDAASGRPCGCRRCRWGPGPAAAAAARRLFARLCPNDHDVVSEETVQEAGMSARLWSIGQRAYLAGWDHRLRCGCWPPAAVPRCQSHTSHLRPVMCRYMMKVSLAGPAGCSTSSAPPRPGHSGTS